MVCNTFRDFGTLLDSLGHFYSSGTVQDTFRALWDSSGNLWNTLEQFQNSFGALGDSLGHFRGTLGQFWDRLQ